MSLENTLREMLNEMKMPPYKERLNPTVHSGPEEKPLPPGVHTGPQKPPVPSHTGSQKPKPKPSEITRTPGRPRPTRGEMQEGIDRKSLVALGAMAASAGTGAMLGKAMLGLHRVPLDLVDAAHVAAARAGRDATDAYHKLQQTADAKGKANAPAMAPGMTKTITAKPRRRLEETLVEHYKQRLQEAIRNT